MERLIRNPFLVIPIIIIIISTSLYFIFHKRHQDIKQEALAEQTVIEDTMRIIVTPLAYLPKTEPRFKVELESYQNPDFTRLDLEEAALIQTNTGKPLLPKKWNITKEEEYRVEGVITFPVTSVPYNRIKLTIFGLSEFDFEWTIPE